MNVLVDTSVWSLALRRDAPPAVPEIDALRGFLLGAQLVVTTGVILQELLQGLLPSRSREAILDRLVALPFVTPDRDDHVAAADLHGRLRRRGVQLGTIDALLCALCERHDLTLLTTDRDFVHAAAHSDLRVWAPA